MKSLMPRALGVALVAGLLHACSPSTAPDQQKPADAAAPVAITAPAGQYELDVNHSSFSFQVTHLGLAPYVMRFTRFNIAVKLDPQNIGASSVTATIDPTSIRTDYPGDYKSGHPESPYKSWEEDLARSPKFLNAGTHPQINFASTSVEQTAPGKLRINGNLTLLGQTQPVTLEAIVTGSKEAHPFTKRGAIGFSATGTFNRSAFGLTHLLQPLLVSDAVTIHFNGQFQQAATTPTPGT